MLILLYYSDVVDEDSERKKLVKDTFAADKAKSEKILQLRNKKNRDIALLERKIDEVPSRGELMQYQRQFVDLYEQVILPSLPTIPFLLSLPSLSVPLLIISLGLFSSHGDQAVLQHIQHTGGHTFSFGPWSVHPQLRPRQLQTGYEFEVYTSSSSLSRLSFLPSSLSSQF